jgi:nitrite reductase/ring-hydroxylating ferredoxin subunit
MAFYPAVPEAELVEEVPRATTLGGCAVLLCRVGGVAVAVVDRCSHAGSPLAGGRVRRGAISCPLHGARFDLRTGENIGGLYPALTTLRTRVSDGVVEVEIAAPAES